MKDALGHNSAAYQSGVENALNTKRPITDIGKVHSFLSGAQGILNNYYATNFGDSPHTMANIPKLEIDNPNAPKYLRIASVKRGADGTVNARSAHTFIDRTTGDVLKPASWQTPAKHARGNVHDASNGLKNMGPHGPAYLR